MPVPVKVRYTFSCCMCPEKVTVTKSFSWPGEVPYPAFPAGWKFPGICPKKTHKDRRKK